MPADVLADAGKQNAPTTPTNPAELEWGQKTLRANYDEMKRKYEAMTAPWDEKIAEAQRRREAFFLEEVQPAEKDFTKALLDLKMQAPPQLKNPPSPPDITMRPFGDPRSNQTAQGIVSTLGLLAQMVAGMVSKTPMQALGAYQGALTGWVEGDRIAAERQWRMYLAEVDKGVIENKNALREWEAIYTQYGANEEIAKALLAAKLHSLGQYDDAVIAAEHGKEGALRTWDRERQLWDGLARDSQHLTEKSWAYQAHQDAMKAQQARDDLHRLDVLSRIKERDAKSGADLTTAGYDDATLNRLAAQYAQGEDINKLVRGRTGASTKAAIEIQRRGEALLESQGQPAAAAMLRRKSLAANTSALAKLAKDESDFNSFLVSFDATLKNTLRLAKEADLGDYPVINGQMLSARIAAGDAKAKNLDAQLGILANELARVTTRQRNTTVEARVDARDKLNRNLSYPMLESLGKEVLEVDAENGRQGFATQRQVLEASIGGSDGGGGEMLPPHAKREGKDIVSESGKYIWRDGKWQPR